MAQIKMIEISAAEARGNLCVHVKQISNKPNEEIRAAVRPDLNSEEVELLEATGVIEDKNAAELDYSTIRIAEKGAQINIRDVAIKESAVKIAEILASHREVDSAAIDIEHSPYVPGGLYDPPILDTTILIR